MSEYIRMGEDEDIISNINDTCFICLEDSSQGKLKRCCSQCYALVHGKCWSKWSSSQQISVLRNILLGEQSKEVELCSICRSGSIQIEHSEDGSEDFSKILSGGLIRRFFRILASRLYGIQYGSFMVSSMGHPFSSLRNLLINGVFLLLFFIYILYQEGNPDTKSIITISLWAYITLLLQFLILTGMYRRQVLNELAIDEPNLTDTYETVGQND
ncbi:RING finger domain-containing protein [Cryptosporidium ubiquitum]|uniref:RING finger domain-containing protein n=1 Tax=Cryptosporidium ubiquitum TaxID=857276 RepID=A0A1J4MLG6_9CRYT|nr:RING finger domain-containing protein [Cryptosporidium ubiquitum]OII75032.1 RING finger domain-containing protein [Cryptosporidium ubiquitum]